MRVHTGSWAGQGCCGSWITQCGLGQGLAIISEHELSAEKGDRRGNMAASDGDHVGLAAWQPRGLAPYILSIHFSFSSVRSKRRLLPHPPIRRSLPIYWKAQPATPSLAQTWVSPSAQPIGHSDPGPLAEGLVLRVITLEST
jgi:hypothetical protein